MFSFDFLAHLDPVSLLSWTILHCVNQNNPSYGWEIQFVAPTNSPWIPEPLRIAPSAHHWIAIVGDLNKKNGDF